MNLENKITIIRLLFSNKKFQSRLIDIYETQFTKHGGDLMAYNIQGVLFKRLKIKPKYFSYSCPIWSIMA